MFLEYRFVLVVALLGAAGALAAEKGRLPLALRGLRKVLARDAGVEGEKSGGKVSRRRRVLAFLLVVAAFALAVWPA